MRVQATKKMANELNKALKGTRFENMMYFSAREISPELFSREVSTDWLEMEHEYNARTGKCRTMRVAYNPELYAVNQYITTRELNKLFEQGDTWETFSRKVFEAYEV